MISVPYTEYLKFRKSWILYTQILTKKYHIPELKWPGIPYTQNPGRACKVIIRVCVVSFISGEWEGTPLFELLNGKVTLNVLPSRLPGFQNCPKYLTTSNNIGLASAGRISSKISDFGGEHSAGRIRHFQAWEFEENKGKSVALMIYIKVTLYAVI